MGYYRSPMCRKICSEHLDLVRHYLGQTDKKHKDWLKTQGLSYAMLITDQVTEFGNKGYQALAEVLKREATEVKQI
jgi:flavorubredoxin